MDREISKRGRDLKGLGKVTVLTDKCISTSKAIIMICCYNYNNQYQAQ